MAKLIVKPTGEQPSRVIELKQGVNRLGRASNNDIMLPFPEISERHCEVLVENEFVFVRDLKSSNGTFISGTVKDYVWVFEISGSAPPAHFIGGWKGAEGFRQPPMYFPKGGSTLRGISKPGEIVWSRIYVTPDGLNMDIGRGGVVKLPRPETERRWQATTWQWPIMHAVTYGVTRDQFMAKHQANHVQVVYGTDAAHADQCLIAKAAMAEALGIRVNLCGTRKGGKVWV